MKPLRIGFLCSEYPPAPHGGLGTFVQALARALARRGHSVRVLGLGERAAAWEDEGVRVRTAARATALAGAQVRAVLDRVRLRAAVLEEHRREPFDVLEVPDYRGEGAFLPATLPLLVRYHGAQSVIAAAQGRRASRLTRWFEGRTLRLSPRHVAPSQAAARGLHALFAGLPEPVMQPHPLAEEFTRFESESLRRGTDFLVLGRFSRSKGADRLLAALPPSLEAFPAARVRVAGAVLDQPEEAWRALLPEPLRPRLEFLGVLPRAEVAEQAHGAAVLLHASPSEAFGLAVLEAAACGCVPVVQQGTGAAEVQQALGEGVAVEWSRPQEVLAAVHAAAGVPAERRGALAQRVRRAHALGPFVEATEALYIRWAGGEKKNIRPAKENGGSADVSL